MKLRMLMAGAACLLLLAPRAGHAVTEGNFTAMPMTTGDLVALCDPEPNSPLATAAVNFCVGFAQGAASVQVAHDARQRTGRLFCLPNPLPARAETLAAFAAWGKANPQRMGEPAADGLFRFLGERFPCPPAR